MTRLRLLVLASTYPRWPGDHEPGFVHELAKRLTHVFDVTVVCPGAPDALDNDTMDGVRVIRFRYAPRRWQTLVGGGGMLGNLKSQPWKWLLVPGFFLGCAHAAWRVLRRERPDLVHAHWLLPQGLVAALFDLVSSQMPPFIVTSHGVDLFALRAAPLQALKRFVAKRAASLTVVSDAMRDELARLGVDPDKISVEPMGVDLQGRFSIDPAVQRSRNEILFVGRMVEKKGLRHLIDAMPAILQHHPLATLTIAGFGPEAQARHEQARRLGIVDRVTFLGPVAQCDLPALYRRAAVFVAPFVRTPDGDQEGLGLVLAEAAGCGCPIVAGDVPAVRDVLRDANVGALVPPGDVAALADAVCTAMSAPAIDETISARRQSVLRFDWQRRAAAYAALLDARVQR